jgi:hypothetical protein
MKRRQSRETAGTCAGRQPTSPWVGNPKSKPAAAVIRASGVTTGSPSPTLDVEEPPHTRCLQEAALRSKADAEEAWCAFSRATTAASDTPTRSATDRRSSTTTAGGPAPPLPPRNDVVPDPCMRCHCRVRIACSWGVRVGVAMGANCVPMGECHNHSPRTLHTHTCPNADSNNAMVTWLQQHRNRIGLCSKHP